MDDQDKTKEQLIEELTELRRCLDALMNNLPEGVMIVDAPDAKVRLASRDGCRMVGATREEFEGIRGDEHFRYYRAFLPGGEPATVEQLPLARALTAGEVIRSEEWVLEISDGTEIPILCHAGPIRDQQGQITGAVISWQDITDRKGAEEALKQAHDELEQRVQERTAQLARANEELAIFRKFAEESWQGFSMAEIDGRLVYLNPALSRMLGDDGPKDRIGRHLSVCYDEQTNRRGREEIEPALTQNAHWEGELAMLSRQGKTIPTWHNSFVIRDESGNPLRLAVVITDISERKAAEEALRASEERFRVTFEEAPVGMVIGFGDGLIAKVNRALCQMSGYTQEELIGRHVRDLTYPEDRDLSAPLVKQFMAGEINRFTIEKRYLRKDGQPFWAQATTAAAHGPDGKFAFALGVVEDITERKAAEAALRQSLDELRAIHEAMADGMHILRLATMKPLRANLALCRMMGYSEEEILTLSPADVHPPEDLPWISQSFQAYLDGKGTGAPDVPLVRKDGQVIYADVTASRIVFHGEPCLVCFFHDTTDRKRTQEALRQERRTLQHMLKASDHERQLIAYDIHDGLAQELAGAVMQFQVYDYLKKAQPEEAQRAYDGGLTLLRQAHGEARRLISGVRPPILDEAGVISAISHLVNERGLHSVPRIEVQSKVHFTRLLPILENAIYRIVQEALANACKHSQSERVRIRVLQRNEQLRIEIRDWGIGFDPTAIPENHFGVEGIRERARLLGGKCSIKSRLGEGTSVIVELPVAERRED